MPKDDLLDQGKDLALKQASIAIHIKLKSKT